MKKLTSLIDVDFYPPFDGFPKEGILFLKKLRRNNNRPWFQRHKEEYERKVKYPLQCLIAELRNHFTEFAPEIEADPKRSMFRIYRDIRFSTDKSPYKTHAAAWFTTRGKNKSGAGFYLHIEPGLIMTAGGIWHPETKVANLIRRAIVDRSKEFQSILNHRQFKKHFPQLDQDEKLQRVPRGFDKSSPVADHLKQKNFTVSEIFKIGSIYRTEFIDQITGSYRRMLPFVRFLNSSLTGMV